jgi:hypothetical protein
LYFSRAARGLHFHAASKELPDSFQLARFVAILYYAARFEFKIDAFD